MACAVRVSHGDCGDSFCPLLPSWRGSLIKRVVDNSSTLPIDRADGARVCVVWGRFRLCVLHDLDVSTCWCRVARITPHLIETGTGRAKAIRSVEPAALSQMS